MQIEFTRHIFATLTYSRDVTLQETWKTVSKDFNRFHQRFLRLHNCRVEYFRVIEEHKDSYPHIHVLLQFPDARIRVENSFYFDRKLHSKWKSLWTRGLSDYQKPRTNGLGTLSYLMKYLIKNQTAKTIWKRVLISTPQDVKDVHTETKIVQPNGLNEMSEPVVVHPTHLNGVKLASWSRKFDWTPLSLRASN